MRYCLGTYVKWANGGLRSRNPRGYGLSLITLAAGQVNSFLAEREAAAKKRFLDTHRHACPHCEDRFRSAAALSVHIQEKHEETVRPTNRADTSRTRIPNTNHERNE